MNLALLMLAAGFALVYLGLRALLLFRRRAETLKHLHLDRGALMRHVDELQSRELRRRLEGRDVVGAVSLILAKSPIHRTRTGALLHFHRPLTAYDSAGLHAIVVRLFELMEEAYARLRQEPIPVSQGATQLFYGDKPIDQLTRPELEQALQECLLALTSERQLAACSLEQLL